MSPKGSVSRKRLPCCRTWTLPRSVAGWMGIERGSMSWTPPASPDAADAANAADAPASAVAPAAAGSAGSASVGCAIVTSGELGQTVSLIGHHEGVDQPIDIAVHHPRERGQVELDPVVGQAILGEVVRPDLLGPIAAADHGPPSRRVRLALLGLLAVVETRAEDRERLGLVLVLALLVLDLDDETALEVGDPDRRIGRVDRLAAGPGRALDVDPDVLLLVDVDLDLVDLGQDHHRGGRRVDPAG